MIFVPTNCDIKTQLNKSSLQAVPKKGVKANQEMSKWIDRIFKMWIVIHVSVRQSATANTFLYQTVNFIVCSQSESLYVYAVFTNWFLM